MQGNSFFHQHMQALGIFQGGNGHGGNGRDVGGGGGFFGTHQQQQHRQRPAAPSKACSFCSAPQTSTYRLKQCPCKEVFYCNVVCQTNDKKNHKKLHKKKKKELKKQKLEAQLRVAIQSRNLDIDIAGLIANPDIDINNAATNSGETPLILSSSMGLAGIVKMLLSRPDINVNKATTDYGHTALYRASSDNVCETVEQLLARPDIDVNKADRVGTTPLYVASIYGHSKTVGLLLDHPRIKVNSARTDNGSTALIVASMKGHVEVVKQLLARHDIDVNNMARVTGESPLGFACQDGHLEVAHLLLGHRDINIHKKSHLNGFSPLDMAIKKDHSEIVAKMLAHSNFGLPREPNSREVCIAHSYNSVESAKVLVWAGFDPTGNDEGRSIPVPPPIRLFAKTIISDHAAFVEFVVCCFGSRRSPKHPLQRIGAGNYPICIHQIESYLVPVDTESGRRRTRARRGLRWLNMQEGYNDQFRLQILAARRAQAAFLDHQVYLGNYH